MNKYRNIKTLYNGITYDSKLEASVARDLDLLLSASEIVVFERQCRLDIIVNGRMIGFYIADFGVSHNDGSFEIIEAKGKWTDLAKWKIRLVHALYNYKITIKQAHQEYTFDGKFKK